MFVLDELSFSCTPFQVYNIALQRVAETLARRTGSSQWRYNPSLCDEHESSADSLVDIPLRGFG